MICRKAQTGLKRCCKRAIRYTRTSGDGFANPIDELLVRSAVCAPKDV